MSRIVAGKFRGRRLEVPAGNTVRPTSSRMRERVFSILEHGRYPDLAGARVADLFAGSGALGLEALSRGAVSATFVEKSPASIDCIRQNIRALKVDKIATLLTTNAHNLPAAEAPYDIVFMDPPYSKGLVEPTLESLIKAGWINPNSAIICELKSDDGLSLPASLEIIDDRSQGKQRTVFLSLKANS